MHARWTHSFQTGHGLFVGVLAVAHRLSIIVSPARLLVSSPSENHHRPPSSPPTLLPFPLSTKPLPTFDTRAITETAPFSTILPHRSQFARIGKKQQSTIPSQPTT